MGGWLPVLALLAIYVRDHLGSSVLAAMATILVIQTVASVESLFAGSFASRWAGRLTLLIGTAGMNRGRGGGGHLPGTGQKFHASRRRRCEAIHPASWNGCAASVSAWLHLTRPLTVRSIGLLAEGGDPIDPATLPVLC